MNLWTHPKWILPRYLSCKSPDELSGSWFDEVNQRLARLSGPHPLVSVVIPAYNEEVNIAFAVDSLSRNIIPFPCEIIVVNNNSTDRTAETLSKLNVRVIQQPVPGCGPARQLGQEQARGKYILTADSDCLYPPGWIAGMTKVLSQRGVSCVYGGYSFLATGDVPRWKFAVYESVRSLLAAVRHVNRPHINAMGMTMGYVRELGLKAGYVQKNIRGEDGRLCFELAKYGRICYVSDPEARIWTLPRTLELEGGITHAFAIRFLTEVSRIHKYLFPQKPHDVRTSRNTRSVLVDLFRSKIQRREAPRERLSEAKEEIVDVTP